MRRRQPISTRTYTLFPYTTLFRSPDPGRLTGAFAYLTVSSSCHEAHYDPRRIPASSRCRLQPHPACLRNPGRLRHAAVDLPQTGRRSEEHTSELQSLMRISYAVFCLKKKHLEHIQHTSSIIH